jgi:hypothetical protein
MVAVRLWVPDVWACSKSERVMKEKESRVQLLEGWVWAAGTCQGTGRICVVRSAVGGRLGVDGAWAVCRGRCLAGQTTTRLVRCVREGQRSGQVRQLGSEDEGEGEDEDETSDAPLSTR